MVLIKPLQRRFQSHTHTNVVYWVVQMVRFYSETMVHAPTTLPTRQIASPREREEEFKPLHSTISARCAFFH